MREVLEALEWVRGEMWRFGSPDFIRQRDMERKVGELCAKLLRGSRHLAHGPSRVPEIKRPSSEVR